MHFSSAFHYTWNVVDVDAGVQILQVQKPQVPYFTYEPARRFISKIIAWLRNTSKAPPVPLYSVWHC